MYINFPCPHCGHVNTLYEDVDGGKQFVDCSGCKQSFVAVTRITVETFTLTPATFKPTPPGQLADLSSYVWDIATGQRVRVIDYDGNTIKVDTTGDGSGWRYLTASQWVPDEEIPIGSQVIEVTSKRQGYVEEMKYNPAGDIHCLIDFGTSYPSRWVCRHHIRLLEEEIDYSTHSRYD